jgi:carbonic anhydrase/acetyltransferase-like protein (isoleucine patch superfamily)
MIRSLGSRAPRIDASAYVNEVAYVVGDVTLGAQSSVWPFAVLRGDASPIVLGERVAVEDGAILHSGSTLTIGNDVIIGHGAIVHCRSIGEGSQIGNGAIILDGAEIGVGCVVAAGALVTSKTVVPAHSLVVGSPGQIKPVQTHHVASREYNTGAYVQRAALYRNSGL